MQFCFSTDYSRVFVLMIRILQSYVEKDSDFMASVRSGSPNVAGLARLCPCMIVEENMHITLDTTHYPDPVS